MPGRVQETIFGQWPPFAARQGRNQTGSGLPSGLMARVFLLYRRCGPGEH